MNMMKAGRSRHEAVIDLLMLLFVLFVAGGMAGLCGLVIGTTLIAHGLSYFELLFISNALSGLLLCSLYWNKRERAQEEKEVLDDRLNKVALMNHYVRNALQILAFHLRQPRGSDEYKAFEAAIRKIEWALVDVLPRGWNLDHLIAKSAKVQFEEIVEQLPPNIAATDARKAG